MPRIQKITKIMFSIRQHFAFDIASAGATPTIFATIDAKLWIASSPNSVDVVTLVEFLRLDMENKIILAIYFPQFTKTHVFHSFKINRRYQNSHAYINAGFNANIISNKICEKPSIVFGGVAKNFVHAVKTEEFLVGKSLRNPSVLRGAFAILSKEVNPEPQPHVEDGSVHYRRLLCQSLFYKFMLVVSGSAQPRQINIQRKLTRGRQTYETDHLSSPVNEPILKLESFPQVCGAAEYINDITPRHGELFAAFVLSTVAKADLIKMDPSEAYKIPGVLRFIQASDIPGVNNYMLLSPGVDEVFASKKVSYYGQSLGLVVAETQLAADQGSKVIGVKYGNVEKGVFTIQQAIQQAKLDGSYKSLFDTVVTISEESDETPTHWIKGDFSTGRQYHFHMENQIAICHPREDGMDVYSSTQWMDLIQASVAGALNIPNNEINVSVRRLGGAFGSKLKRCSQIATACAIAAHSLHRPVRLAMDLSSNMMLIGKRSPFYMKYKMGVNSVGRILELKANIFCDSGSTSNDHLAKDILPSLQNSIYSSIGWELRFATVKINTAPNAATRAPDTAPAIALLENLMDHVATELNLDSFDVRNSNMGMNSLGRSQDFKIWEEPQISLIPGMIQELETSAKLQQRKEDVQNFNKSNRWIKKGLCLIPMSYPIIYSEDAGISAYVAIYKNDATVVVSHGGIEMGQGVNTKVAQVVALELGIPVTKIRIKSASNLLSPNAYVSGASIASELSCFAAQQACKELKERMSPIQEEFNPTTWKELVQLCHSHHINLAASSRPYAKRELRRYNVWVVNLTEVEIDVLTGEHKIVRVDIIEDAGRSLNPAIDIGQVEGALVMGIGHWTTEKLLYDPTTGQLLSNGTWLYNPPLPKDIPEDFRVTLLKNAPNPAGFLSSKATGEPPLCSAVAVLFALKNAIYSAREDAGHKKWFRLDGPVTVEDVLTHCLTNSEQFQL